MTEKIEIRCGNCDKQMELKISEESVQVGDRVSTSVHINRFCDECRKNFLQEMRGYSSEDIRVKG